MLRRASPDKIVHVKRALLWFVALLGCARPSSHTAIPWAPEGPPPPDVGPVVARVAGVPIFASEVAGQAAKTGKSPRAALDELVSFHLLAARGRDAWPPRDRAAIEALDEILVQRLLERDLEPHLGIDEIPEEHLRRIYDRIKTSYVHPRLVEVAVISVWPGVKATGDKREQARATARELKAVIDASKDRTPELLERLAADPKWTKRQARYFKFLQALPGEPYGKEFREAVLRLKGPGDTTPIVEDGTGFHIARYVSERPESNRGFAEVRAELRDRYYPEWRKARFEDFCRQLATRHTVELITDNLRSGASAPL